MTAATWDMYVAIFLVVLPNIYKFSWPVGWFDTSYSAIVRSEILQPIFTLKISINNYRRLIYKMYMKETKGFRLTTNSKTKTLESENSEKIMYLLGSETKK